MKLADTMEQAWGNLWKKKLRTVLTICGVVIGIGSLVCMFAFGQGIQRNIQEQFEQLELFNYVNVSVKKENRDRQQPGDPNRPTEPAPAGHILDDQFLTEVMQIEGVEAVFPELRFPAQIRMGSREQFNLIQVLPAQACRSEFMQLRAGTPYTDDEPNELIISSSLLRRLGIKDPKEALGREVEIHTLTLDFSLASLLRVAFARNQGLPLSRHSYAFSVKGVQERSGFGGPLPVKSDVFIPPGPALAMKKLELTSIWDFFKPIDDPGTYSMVSVKVSAPHYVASVQQTLESRGLKTFALLDNMDEMMKGFIIMDMFLLAVGMIGMTVAFLGIVNTMVMSILERYREIGIMKAVGATDGDVQRIFFYESGMIGLLGGVFGLGLAWVVSFIINQVVNSFATRQGAPFIQYFNFPFWLCASAVLFSVLVSLIAGIYPTRRATRVDPVIVLRHD